MSFLPYRVVVVEEESARHHAPRSTAGQASRGKALREYV
jgi:hypothetical protein